MVRAVMIVVILAAGVVRSGAQPSVEAARSQAELGEARQLDQQVERLFGEGKYPEALARAQRALAIRERALGPDHLDIARSLDDLGVLYAVQSAYAKAEPLVVRALAIREKALGPDHLDVAQSLNNLANIYSRQGAHAKAEPLHVRALAIREKVLGPHHPLVATSLNNLASLHRAQGEYAKAEPLLVRALAIHEKALGPDHPDVATSLNNLAGIYSDQGAYAKAESLHVRALAILEKALGPNHPHVATSLDNLASLYEAQGEYAKAEPLQVRALAIYEQLLGPDHPDVASSLGALAVLYQDEGRYALAESLHVRALTIQEKALGPKHLLVATTLNNLALLYKVQGAYARAQPLQVRALAILEKALGPKHPLVAICLYNLARIHVAQGAHAKAQPLLARATDIQEQQLRTDLVRLPEPRKRALMTLLQQDTDSVVSFHADAAFGRSPALDLALTTVLRRKGRILDSMVDGDSRIRRNLTPDLRDLLDQLSRARSDLAARLYPRGSRRTAADRAAADAARERIDELETRASVASAEFRTQAEPVSIAKVRAMLPGAAALVEFARYRRADPRRRWSSRPQEDRYVAYLLTASGASQAVALGEAAAIDAQVDAMLAAIRDTSSVATIRAALQRLDALVLAPVRARLPGVSHLILAPDSQLNLVPFEALVDPQGRYALETYLISYVTSGRDLLRLAAPRGPRSPAVIVADPAYGPLPRPGSGAMSFRSLPDARAEAMDLQTFFPGAPLTGEEATKARLTALTGPAILHIITHGFYARDAASGHAAPGLLRDAARDLEIEDSASLQALPTRSDDLADGLDRAGLALAGANQGADGIVTAREIAGFDWWGTQLVVLSACETGVGAASSGDGVYGLRRALVLAGAASQVVSLWSVADSAARALMRDYYGRLARGAGRAEGLRQAKLALLRQPQYAHPFFWAPFIAAGDWRPLDKGILAPPKPAP